ncbi:molybdopterin oxidoreductase family protein [Burkholderia pseudomallei 305]|nr:molybdopterin oxidoreductase family protein [Burkholderia pseudomallei 305]
MGGMGDGRRASRMKGRMCPAMRAKCSTERIRSRTSMLRENAAKT